MITSFNQIDIAQRILNKRHPGMSASTLLMDMDDEIFSGIKPDIFLISDVLYDGFTQTSLELEGNRKRIYINQPETLFPEIIKRFIQRSAGPGFVDSSRNVFERVECAHSLYRAFSHMLDTAQSNPSLALACKKITSNDTWKEHKQFINDTFALSVARRAIESISCMPLRRMYNPEAPSSKRPSFKLLALEKTRQTIEEADVQINAMSDAELTHRAIRALEQMELGNRNPEYPVYGVPTIYAYMPAIIDRLFNPSWIDNAAVHAQIIEKCDAVELTMAKDKASLARISAEASVRVTRSDDPICEP